MSDVLAQFGVDESVLPTQTGFEYSDVVPGRVAHIDADFICYMASAETKDEKDGLRPRKTFQEMCERAMHIVDHYRRLARAETAVLHITPSASSKGGRNAQAVLKPYQGNRKDMVKPEHLDAVRAFVGEHPNGVVHLDREADDGMTEANYLECLVGNSDASIIVSKDKDLRMAPGLHWCFDEEEIIDVSDWFGSTWLDKSKSAAKGSGWGTKFFWLQMLMGDTADNISGLPRADGYTLWLTGNAAKETQKHKLCGPALAVSILEGLENDQQCWDTVKYFWEHCPDPMVHHETQEPVDWSVAMMGDAQLLWMRRFETDTVIKWIIEEVQ